MRGTEEAWTRGGAAGLIWGAAFLALVGLAGNARGQDQVALAIPRPVIGGAPGLPGVLGPADATLYRRIFAAQERGHFAAADADLARLSDRLLVGHVLADRLLGPHTRARADELAAWLRAYGDHPDAPRIHRLLAVRAPRGTVLPAAPEFGELPAAETPPEEIEAAPRAFTRNLALERSVRQHLRAESFERALAEIRSAHDTDPAHAASLRAEVARALFLRNEDETALATAREAARGAGAKVAEAHWIAGLAAWRLVGHLADVNSRAGGDRSRRRQQPHARLHLHGGKGRRAQDVRLRFVAAHASEHDGGRRALRSLPPLRQGRAGAYSHVRDGRAGRQSAEQQSHRFLQNREAARRAHDQPEPGQRHNLGRDRRAGRVTAHARVGQEPDAIRQHDGVEDGHSAAMRAPIASIFAA